MPLDMLSDLPPALVVRSRSHCTQRCKNKEVCLCVFMTFQLVSSKGIYLICDSCNGNL